MRRKYFCFSALGHLIILIIISASVIFLQQKKAEIKSNHFLPTYIYQEKKNNLTQKQKKIVSKIALEKTKIIKTAPSSSVLSVLSVAQAETLKSQTIPAKENTAGVLLTILHDAIAAKQIYPDSAIELNQTGTVTIGFRIFPDGHIENIKLIKSSEIDSLDASALSAVSLISPVKEANNYLKSAEFLTIDVVFQ